MKKIALFVLTASLSVSVFASGAAKPKLSEIENNGVSKYGHKHLLETTKPSQWDLQEHDRFKTRKECEKAAKEMNQKLKGEGSDCKAGCRQIL